MLKPNRVLDFQPICPLSPRERVEDIETLPCFRFSANLSLLPAGGGVEDTEPQPLWDFSQFCPLSPWEWGGERAVSRRLTLFRKKSSERSSERLSGQEAARSENKQSEFRQHGTLKPFQKGKYDEIQPNPFVVYCRSFSYRSL